MDKSATRHDPRGRVGVVSDRPPLEVSVACEQPLSGVLVVRLRGDLDLGTAGPVRNAVTEAVARTDPHRLVLDLSEVTLLSSHGMDTLMTLLKNARAQRFHLVLTGASRRAVRLPLRIAGLLPLFDIRPDVAHALTGATGPATPPAHRGECGTARRLRGTP